MREPSNKPVMIIGQAPARPGSKHEVPGAYLRPWLYDIGLSEDEIISDFAFAALMNEFPGSRNGSHLPPTREQIEAHRPTLESLIKATQPKIVVPVGRLAIASFFPGASITLDAIIGQAYEVDPYGVLGRTVELIPLPHPSGRSTWVHAYRHLVEKALDQLAQKISLETRRPLT